MEVRMRKFGDGPSLLEEFAKHHGLTMRVTEHSIHGPHHGGFTANFEYVEVIDRSCLISEYGRGSSPAEAISAYADKLRGRRIVFDPFGTHGGRREINVPNDLHVAERSAT